MTTAEFEAKWVATDFRDLDAWVAEKVMGWTWWTRDLCCDSCWLGPPTILHDIRDPIAGNIVLLSAYPDHTKKEEPWWLSTSGRLGQVPGYTTRVGADHEVLAYIKHGCGWDGHMKGEFVKLLGYWWNNRRMASSVGGVLEYRVGDFSRAALECVEVLFQF